MDLLSIGSFVQEQAKASMNLLEESLFTLTNSEKIFVIQPFNSPTNEKSFNPSINEKSFSSPKEKYFLPKVKIMKD